MKVPKLYSERELMAKVKLTITIRENKARQLGIWLIKAGAWVLGIREVVVTRHRETT